MSKYLYGAAVQGIQGFIFQTSKLQEIAGASELVKEICTTAFFELAKIDKDDSNIIKNAAGNIQYIFENEQRCKDFVRVYPKRVMEKAPGITVSQAVVKFEEGNLNDSLQCLEEKLRAQRNKISTPFEIGFMGTGRARRTGGVAYLPNPLPKENEIVCEATIKKLDASKRDSLFGDISDHLHVNLSKDLWTDIDKVFKNDNKTWIAVIHADGNGLGAIIQNLNKSLQNQNDNFVKEAFRKFSLALDKSTKAAAQFAFKGVVQGKKENDKPYPIRPIILGGDDLTIIIKAGLALEFTIAYLREFEKQTQKNLHFLKREFGIAYFEKGITACAGIAYVKKAYPFHYAVDLAEKLCGDAKSFVKGKGYYENINPKPQFSGLIPKSSLSFFKVQDSYIEASVRDLKKRVLTRVDVNFDYGPYLIEVDDKFANVGELTERLKTVEKYAQKAEQEKGANGISKLRQWVTESLKDKNTAEMMLKRMSDINAEFYSEMKPGALKNGKSMIYDVIQLNSFNEQV